MISSPTRQILGAVLAALVAVALVLLGSRFRGRGGAPAGDGPLAAVGPAAGTPVDWPQFHGNPAQTGAVSGHLPATLHPVWRFQTEDSVTASPVIHAGRVYVGSADEHVYALDLDSGRQVWATLVDDAVEATAAVLDDSVFVGTMAGTVYALHADTGQVRWTYATEDKIAGAVNWFKNEGGGLFLLVGSYDASIYCLDAQTGQVHWTYETDNYVNGSPAVGEGRCASGGCDALIRMLDLADGRQTRAVDSGSQIAGSAALCDGHVYVGTYGGELVKAPLDGNEVLWRYGTGGDPFLSSPAVTDELVVIGGGDGKVHAVDRDTGRARWAFAALDTVDSSPAVCGDKVVVGSLDGRLYLLALDDGRRLWSYELGQAITSSPAIAAGTVVVGCDDGRVYAFR